jgi:hypothetical protein
MAEDLMEDLILVQHLIKERITMTQLAEMNQLVENQGMGLVQCDSCSARAIYEVILPYGDLAFCRHHYNKNAVALTNQGGIAKILSIDTE